MSEPPDDGERSFQTQAPWRWAERVFSPAMAGTSAPEHVGQLFDEPASLGRSAAAFLLDDATPDTILLVVAKPAHWRVIAGELEGRGYPLESRMLDGRLQVLDSSQLL